MTYQVIFSVHSQTEFGEFCERLYANGGCATVVSTKGCIEVAFDNAARSLTEAVSSAANVAIASGGEVMGIRIAA
jgi:hypothetical protein